MEENRKSEEETVETDKMIPKKEKKQKKYIKIKQFKIPIFDVDGKPMMRNPSFSVIGCGVIFVFAFVIILGLVLVSFHRFLNLIYIFLTEIIPYKLIIIVINYLFSYTFRPHVIRIQEYNKVCMLGKNSPDMFVMTRKSPLKSYQLTAAQTWFWHKGTTLRVS